MKLQNALSTGDVNVSYRYFFMIPLEIAHCNHPVGPSSTMASKRMKPIIQERIAELVLNGIYCHLVGFVILYMFSLVKYVDHATKILHDMKVSSEHFLKNLLFHPLYYLLIEVYVVCAFPVCFCELHNIVHLFP